jgi:hypothetical protein
MKYLLAIILCASVPAAHAGLFDVFEDMFSKTGIFHKKGNGRNRAAFDLDGPIFPPPPLIDIPPDGFDENPLDDPKDPIAAVPVPAAVWLFVSGLMGLICIARRKNG